MIASRWLASAVVLALEWSASAEPGARSAALRVTSAPLDDCPSGAELEAAIERRLQRRIFASGSPELLLRLGFERAAARGYAARIALHDAQGRLRGERVLSVDVADCRELEPSVVLVLALLLDSPPDPVAAPTPPAAAAPPTAVKPTPAPPTPAPSALKSVAPSLRIEANVGVAGGHALGPLGFGLRAGIGVAPLWGWLLRGEVTRWLPTDAELDGTAAGARLSGLGFALLVCPVRRWVSPELWGCLGGRTEFIEIAGFGFADADRAAATTAALDVRVGAALALVGPLRLRAGLAGLVALQRPELRYRDELGESRSLRTAPVVGAELELGLGLTFPEK